jgi:hypothetical protein
MKNTSRTKPKSSKLPKGGIQFVRAIAAGRDEEAENLMSEWSAEQMRFMSAQLHLLAKKLRGGRHAKN